MNALHQDLTNKVVVIRPEGLRREFHALPHRLFRVTGGFGAQPETLGQKIFGTWLGTGTDDVHNGMDVERLATEADLQALEHARLAAQHPNTPAPEEASHA